MNMRKMLLIVNPGKLKLVMAVCLLLIGVTRSYPQDSLKKDILLPIVHEFAINNTTVNTYEELPEFIRHYVDGISKETPLKLKRVRHFNGGCSARIKRSLFYILKSGNNYVVSYAHGGMGRHFHSVIFMTNGELVSTVYNVSCYDHKEITELVKIIENGWYSIQVNWEL